MFIHKNFLKLRVVNSLRILSAVITLFFLSIINMASIPNIPGNSLNISNQTVTPFGLLSSECVHVVPSGTSIIDNETALLPNKTIVYFKKCSSAYQYNNATTTSTHSDVSASSFPTNGWVEDAETDFVFDPQAQDVQAIQANWIVPQAPWNDDGQIIYLFVGAEPADGSSIAQPVLEWRSGTGYRIASWYHFGNTGFESTPAAVQSGDSIYGISANLGSSWSTYIQDNNHPTVNSILYGNSMTSFVGKVAFGGALEVYDLYRCSDYPRGSSVEFTNVYLDTDLGRLTNPGFSSIVRINDGCSESVSIPSTTSVSLRVLGPTTSTISTTTTSISTSSTISTSTISTSTTSTIYLPPTVATPTANPTFVRLGQNSTISDTGASGGLPSYTYQWLEIKPPPYYGIWPAKDCVYITPTSCKFITKPDTLAGTYYFELLVQDSAGITVVSDAVAVRVYASGGGGGKVRLL